MFKTTCMCLKYRLPMNCWDMESGTVMLLFIINFHVSVISQMSDELMIVWQPWSNSFKRPPVFSPGCGLAGFPEEKLKWRIKTKKMRPLGRRGKLRVKRNASPVLDLIRSIILSAKFSEKFIYESKNNWRRKTPVVLLCKNMHQLETSLQVDRFYHTKKVVALLFENPTAKNFPLFRFLTAKKFLRLAGFKHNLKHPAKSCKKLTAYACKKKFSPCIIFGLYCRI